MYLIRDETNDSQQLPLARFLEAIRSAGGRSDKTVSWRVTQAGGYGLDVCRLENSLEGRESVPIDSAEVSRVSRDRDQWFYDLCCIEDAAGLYFGVLDSGALFIWRNDELCKEVVAGFDIVTRENSI